MDNAKIDEIRQRAHAVQVIGRYVTLQKKGHRYVGLCPFHQEKTPSFSVSEEKGLFYCFGCQAGGDVFAFVMKYHGLDFVEATRKLAAEVGVELEQESAAAKELRRQREMIAKVNTYAASFFEHALWQPEGRPARDYLRKRGITDDQAKVWRLGYGGGSGELFAFLTAKKIPEDHIQKAELFSGERNRGLFEGRLVFTIVDALGRIAGFGGRSLEANPAAKYVNSRESALFQKHELLYGLPQAQEAIRLSRRVVIVEGYMDVLACHAAGIKTAVAALGTAFSEDHAKACARLAQEAVVLLDGDAAGIRASYKAVQQLLQQSIKTLLAPLPDQHDPDSLLREKGSEALRHIVDQSKSAIEYFMEQAFVGTSGSIEDRARAAQKIAPLLATVTSGLERDLYWARLAQQVGMPVEQLQKHLREFTKKAPDKVDRSAKTKTPPKISTKPMPVDPTEVDVIRELLLFPDLRRRFTETLEFLREAALRQIVLALAESDDPVAEILEKHVEDAKLRAKLNKVKPMATDGTEHAEVTFNDILRRLRLRDAKVLHREVLEELKSEEKLGHDTSDLERRLQTLTRTIQELKRPGLAAKNQALLE